MHGEHRVVTGALAAAHVDRGELLGNEHIKVIQRVAPASERKPADSTLRAVRPAEAPPATTQAAPWRASGPSPRSTGTMSGWSGDWARLR